LGDKIDWHRNRLHSYKTEQLNVKLRSKTEMNLPVGAVRVA
jgi:hypothetical protein